MPDDSPDRVAPPRSWGKPAAHLAAALSHPWYKAISRLTAVIASATSEFYRARDIAPALLPVTCGAVSSPAGLGSDSLPVQVSLHGQRIYLADSMQFQLE